MRQVCMRMHYLKVMKVKNHHWVSWATSLAGWASLDPLPILAYRSRKMQKKESHEDKVERRF